MKRSRFSEEQIWSAAGFMKHPISVSTKPAAGHGAPTIALLACKTDWAQSALANHILDNPRDQFGLNAVRHVPHVGQHYQPAVAHLPHNGL